MSQLRFAKNAAFPYVTRTKLCVAGVSALRVASASMPAHSIRRNESQQQPEPEQSLLQRDLILS
jgi:hypothetical protein